MATTSAPSVDQLLDGAKQKFGFVPNVLKEMAVSPVLLQSYIQGQAAMANASLTPQEQQIVQLTISHHNECNYCCTAHGMGAIMSGVGADEVQAVRSGQLPSDQGQANLVKATLLVLNKKGALDVNDIETLDSQGITKEKVYEIVALIGLKIMTNYTNHIGQTVLDEQFGD